MLNKAINIVCFDIPFPANYGGVIDVFYKIKSLHKHNVKVYLHCFEYGRKHAMELEELCEKVYYYPRKTGFLNNLSSLPYTVKSRISEELVQNLLANSHPILFEVLNTCYLLNDPRFKDRFKIYRHSNIEHDYYRHLAHSEKRFINRLYLKAEANKLERFEKVLEAADLILAVSTKDLSYFKTKFPKVRTEYLPSFHSNSDVNIKSGKGDYVLYHGNLSVSENYEAANWLIKNVFSKINFPVKIAGLAAPEFLRQEIKKHNNIELISDPDEKTMNALIENAQIHTLFTTQDTGLKLKLLNVLFKGRFVVCNSKMTVGTNLNSLDSFFVTDSVEKYIDFIEKSKNLTFESQFSIARKQLLEDFDCDKSLEKLMSFLP